MKHRPSKTSHIYSYTKIQKIKQRDRSRRSSPPILLPRSGTSSGERDSGGSIVPRRNVFRSSRSPWKASWRCITKRWRGSRVCTNLPSSSSSSSSSRRRSGERRDPRKGRETTVEYREQQLGGKTKKERRRRRRKRGGSVGGVCSLLPGDRVHRLLRCRCPEIKNLREPGRSDNRRWDSLFHRKLIGEIGWRGKKEDLDEIYYPSEGEGRTLIVEECSSPGNRVELARSAFRNGKHCCTLYPGLHKPGTPHSANSRGLLSSRECSTMIQERVIFLREIREFSCVEQKKMFERVWSTIYEDLPGTSSLPGILFGENSKFSVYNIRKFQNFVCRCSIFYWSMNTLLYRTCIFQTQSIW